MEKPPSPYNPNLQSALQMKQLPALDGFRALAAFLVVFYHAGLDWMPGGLGVLGFFVLSGFLITWLLLKEREHTGTVSLKGFYLRRSLRIFPAAYAYWLLIVVVLGLVLGKRVVWPQAISSFFYYTNYWQAFNGDPNTGLSHTWSLAVEEQFYLLWPALFLLLARQMENMAKWLLFLILGLWAYRLALIFVFHVHQGYIYEAFDTRADHMLIGCLVAIILRHGQWKSFWNTVCASPWLAGLPVIGLVLSSVATYHYGTDYRNAIGFIIEPVLIAIMLPQWMAFHNSNLWGWLNWGWLRYLGKISYSTYLYQQLVIYPVQKATASLPYLLQLAVVCVAVVAVASLSYWVIEMPFLKLKEKFRKE